MALQCPSCGSVVGVGASKCQQCGQSMNIGALIAASNPRLANVVTLFVLVALAAVFMAWCR